MNLESLRDTWLMFQRDRRCSIDRMLCDPELRREFLQAARPVAGCDDEQQLLWSLVGLRKKKTLPSTLR